MSGNVAEMVIYDDGSIGTKGGSFTSIGQELQIVEGKDRFNGVIKPNVNIGFRPVMTYLGRGIYKATFTPPGTVKVTDKFYFDKTEVSNVNWREYENWNMRTYGKNSDEYINSLPDTTVWVMIAVKVGRISRFLLVERSVMPSRSPIWAKKLVSSRDMGAQT